MTTNNEMMKEEARLLILSAGTQQDKLHYFAVKLFKAVCTDSTDWTILNYLWKGLGRGTNKSALKAWIVEFSPLVYSKELDEFKRTKKAKWDLALIEKGRQNPFYAFEKEKTEVETEFDYNAKIKTLTKRIKALVEECNTNGADVSKLEAILAIL